MRIGERERFVTRLRQIRRNGATTNAPASDPNAPANARASDPNAPASDPQDLDRTQLLALEERIAHLEKLLEGLQDAVHRESERHGKRLTELETQIQPAALGEAMSKDARERGL